MCCTTDTHSIWCVDVGIAARYSPPVPAQQEEEKIFARTSALSDFPLAAFFLLFSSFFLLKALLPPRSIRFLLRSTFHIECLVSNSFFNAPANSSLAYVRFKPWFYLTPWQFFSIRTPFLTLSCKICREICLLFNPLPYDPFSDHSSVRYSMSCMWNIKILGSLYALDMCLVSWKIIAEA